MPTIVLDRPNTLIVSGGQRVVSPLLLLILFNQRSGPLHPKAREYREYSRAQAVKEPQFSGDENRGSLTL